jgi:multiple sugar transport system permease protein
MTIASRLEPVGTSLPATAVGVRRSHRHERIASHAVVAVLLVLILLPFLWLVQMAFRPTDDIFGDQIWFVPTLANFEALLGGKFVGSFVNSLPVSSLSTGIALVFGVPAAFVLSRWRFRGHGHIALWILTARMAPPIAFTIPFFLAYRWLGLQDTVIGLAIIYLTLSTSRSTCRSSFG